MAAACGYDPRNLAASAGASAVRRIFATVSTTTAAGNQATREMVDGRRGGLAAVDHQRISRRISATRGRRSRGAHRVIGAASVVPV
eukprot:101624-Pleurochrysis_carterae.AAC.4